MPYDPNQPDSAEPGELLDVILEELDAALVEARDFPEPAFEWNSTALVEALRDAEAMRDRLKEGRATPDEADEFARRCRAKLDRMFGTDTATTDPMARH